MGIKHYDIDGVADTLQLGKRGPSIKATEGMISHLDAEGNLVVLKAASSTQTDAVSTFGQLQIAINNLAANIGVNLMQLNTQLQASLSDQTNTMQAQASEIASLQSMVAALMPVAPETYNVTPGMTAATLLGNLKAGARVASISIEVKTAFDGGASLEIGDGSVPDFYMSADHSDLQYPGTYTMTPPEGAPDSMITATLTGTATVGAATIRIEYA